MGVAPPCGKHQLLQRNDKACSVHRPVSNTSRAEVVIYALATNVPDTQIVTYKTTNHTKTVWTSELRDGRFLKLHPEACTVCLLNKHSKSELWMQLHTLYLCTARLTKSKLSVKRLSERPAALPPSCTRSARYIEPRSYPASGARTRYGEQEIHKVTWLSLSPASVAARSISRSWWVSWLVSREVVCYIVSCEYGVPWDLLYTYSCMENDVKLMCKSAASYFDVILTVGVCDSYEREGLTNENYTVASY